MKPILFNTEMVQAILDGRKTTTRRNPFLFRMKGEVSAVDDGLSLGEYYTGHIETGACLYKRGRHGVWQVVSNVVKPKYNVGDILYVRETWQCFNPYSDKEYVYKATNDYSDVENMKWHPSIHMPKEAARIFLRVTDVRVERLREIDKYWRNYEQEGMRKPYENISIRMQERFISIWNSTIKKADLPEYGWDANPWVWVYGFERCEKPGEGEA